MYPSKWIFINQMRKVFVLSELMDICNYIHYCSLSLMHKCWSPFIRERIRSPDIKLLFPPLLYMGIEAPSALWFPYLLRDLPDHSVN